MKRANVVSLAAGLVAFAIVCHAQGQDQDQDEPTAVRQTFETNCAACHGSGGAGGERAPALNGNPDLRKRSAPEIENIIRQGTSGGMPAFSSLPASDVAALAGWIHSMNLSALSNAPLEQIRAGEQFFFGEGALLELPYGARPRRSQRARSYQHRCTFHPSGNRESTG